MSIQALGVDSRLVRAVSELGFTQPTAIQEKAIPLILAGKDIIGHLLHQLPLFLITGL